MLWSLLALAVVAVACIVVWRVLGALRAVDVQLDRLEARLAEARRAARASNELETRRKQIEDTVDWGTASIETIHRTIADLSFDLWGPPSNPAREVHDRTVEQVYGTVRYVNRGVGTLLSGLLDPERRKRED